MSEGPPRGVLAALCLTVTVSYGTLYYAFAVLAPAITEDTGWSLTAITAAFSGGSLATGLIGVVAGRAIQERGPRLVMVAGGLAGAAGLAGVAAAASYPWFVVAMLVCGASAAGLFYAPAFAAITHWYGARRVEALTALTLVAGFSSTIFAPLVTLLESHLDWRTVYLVLAGLQLVVTVPAHAIALRPRWVPSPAAHGTTDRVVLASRGFVLVAVASTLLTLAMYASIVALVPLLVGRGISPVTAAWALGLSGAGQVAGRLLYRRLARVLGVRRCAAAVSGALAVTVLALGLVPGPVSLVVAIAIVAGAARGLFTLVGATLVSEVWGPERYAAINGVLGAPMAAAAAVGPFAGAWLALVTGGYPATFAVLAAVAGGGAVLLFVGIGTAQRPLPSAATPGTDGRPGTSLRGDDTTRRVEAGRPGGRRAPTPGSLRGPGHRPNGAAHAG